MMELVRGWLLGITGAAILAAVADGLMPEGGVRQVGKLVCGLVLLFAVLAPLSGGNGFCLTQVLGYDEGQLEQDVQRLKEETNEQMKQIIQEELSAYSMDKVQQMGLDCQVRVLCEADEQGLLLPREVQVHGLTRQEEKQLLVRELAQELGVDDTRFTFLEGGG